jgi:hypothetical protein
MPLAEVALALVGHAINSDMNIWNDKEAIQAAVQASESLGDTIIHLGFNPKGSITRRKLNNAIEHFKICTKHFGRNGKPKVDWADKHKLDGIVKTCTCLVDVLKKLDLYKCAGNYTTLRKYINLYDIDTSHFVDAKQQPKNKIPLQDILGGLHPSYKTYALKVRLIKENILKNECSICSITEYNNKPISLELDHINGVNDDHQLSNLRILCPNCHSQTDTYKGKNRHKAT